VGFVLGFIAACAAHALYDWLPDRGAGFPLVNGQRICRDTIKAGKQVKILKVFLE
jgi:hypothetical protein